MQLLYLTLAIKRIMERVEHHRYGFSIILLITWTTGVGCCGSPAVPNYAEIRGWSWDLGGNHTFEEGSNLTFSCQTGFGDISQSKVTKTCSKNGTWDGPDIYCYETRYPFHGICIVNNSGSPFNCSSLYNKEFTGNIELILEKYSTLPYLKIHYQNKESFNPPRVMVGNQNCSQKEVEDPSSNLTILYNCNASVTHNVFIIADRPTTINDIVMYFQPESKCHSRPEVPLNALVKKEGPLTVRYLCGECYSMTGNGTSSCHPETGRWSDPPLCEIREDVNTMSSGTITSIVLSFVFVVVVVVVVVVVICCWKRRNRGTNNVNDRRDFEANLWTWLTSYLSIRKKQDVSYEQSYQQKV